MDGSNRAVRLDIQALRAAAVAMVVVYHLAPNVLPGGFVGVDVFFVISGFLITTLLIERPPTNGRGLLEFWARRIRRLLPASLVVLAVTLVATWIALPQTQWQATAEHARAAAVYVVNWVLIADAIDYLASEQAPTAIQHFWSLAVEEQFYVGWPILILGLALLARGRRRRLAFALGIGVATVASFAYSVHLTSTNPAVAYFSTGTRIWELGVGGLLAVAAPTVAGRLGTFAPVLLAATGWIAIAVTGLRYSDSTPFPGWQAALPVAGTLLIIATHREFRWQGLLPVHWLGDVSYSVYLWHWPLILLMPAAIAIVAGSPERGALDNAVIVVVTLVLSGLSKVYVEDRYRYGRVKPTTKAERPRLRSTYASAAIGMAVIVALASSLVGLVNHQREVYREQLERALTTDDPCLGAGAMNPSLDCRPPKGPLVPSPALAAKDVPPAYDEQANGEDCLARASDYPIVTCHFGEPSTDSHRADFEVALVGNSHAAHWVPTLDTIAKNRHWRVTTYLAASCSGTYNLTAMATMSIARRCVGWGTDVVARLRADPPDLIVFATHMGRSAWAMNGIERSLPTFEAGFHRMFVDLARAERPIVVIRDTPQAVGHGVDSIPDCIAEHRGDSEPCNGRRTAWMIADPAATAARGLRARNLDITVADLTDYFCDKITCFAAIGGVITYFDGHHISATYARTLAPYLDKVLTTALLSESGVRTTGRRP
jgi:peptidoglycan/LPS O-acetylase OafA/YrhL